MTDRAFHFDPGRHRLTLDGLPIPSVTGILSGGLPKPALKHWAAKSVAEFAYDNGEAWRNLPRDAAIDMLKREPLRFTGQRARVGTAVHGAVAAHVAGAEPPEDLTDEEWGFFNAARSYLADQKVEVLGSELTVYSREHAYGGTFDLLQRRPGCELEIADFKTSKAVYPDVALQLVAYARAEFIGHMATGEEEPLPLVDRGVIIRLGADGRYEAVPCPLTENHFRVFRACRAIYEWDKGLSRRTLEPALAA